MLCRIQWPFPHWRVAGGPWYPFGVPRLGLPVQSLCLGMCLASIAVLCDSSSRIARVFGVVVAKKGSDSFADL